MHVDERDVMRAAVLLEDIFLRMCDNIDATLTALEIRKQWSNIDLRIKMTGNEFNPLDSENISDDNDADYYRDILIKAYQNRLGYSYRNGCNIVSITVHKAKSSQVHRTIIAMVAGVIVGFLLKVTMPAYIVTFINSYILDSVRTIFFNALNLMCAPLVFFSIMKGIGNVSDTSDLGRLGMKMTALYVVTTIFSALIALAVGMIFFSGDIPQIGKAVESSQSDFSVLNTLIGIVPKTLIEPLIVGNMMQIIFMAISSA